MPRDNYWEWENRPAPQAKAGSYRRKYGTSWWGKQFLAALERMDYSGRLGRGKTYANKGLVEKLEQPRPGRLSAEVRGSMPRPYEITIDWTPWTKGQAEAIREDIQGNPAILGKLLTGTLPEELMDVLKARDLTLFPSNFGQLRATCSCPDYAVPCKHMAALLYVMAGAIDADPFYLFAVRGLDLKAGLVPPSETEKAQKVIKLADLLQPVAATPPFSWDEALYRSVDFTTITDTGWRAVSKLPDRPAFDGGDDFLSFLDKVYTAASRYAGKLYKKDAEAVSPASELIPPGGQLELHQDKDLLLSKLAFFNDEDEALLELQQSGVFLAWLQDLEQLDRHQLTKETSGVLLFFQLARTLVQRKAYVPRLLEAAPGEYLVQYVPASSDPALNETLESCYQLLAPTLLYYVDDAGDFSEFRAKREGEQLLSCFIGLLVGGATANRVAETPARGLFLLRGRRRFDLLGTEGFPLAIDRWLSQLYLAERRYGIILKIEEVTDGLRVEVLITDREDTQDQLPVALHSWMQGSVPPAEKLTVVKTLSFLSAHFPELNDYLAENGKSAMRFSVNGFTPVLTAVLPSMEALGIRVLLPAALRKLLRPALGLNAQSKPGTEVFELSGIISLDSILRFSWQAALGDQPVSEDEFRNLLTTSTGLVKFREQYVMIDEAEVARLLKQLDGGAPILPPHERLEALFTEEYLGGPVRIGPDLRRLIEKLRTCGPTPLPHALHATLRPYQQRGYDWLYLNAGLGFGSILADDMGLGKTLQVITLLLKYAEEGLLDQEKAIVIVPD